MPVTRQFSAAFAAAIQRHRKAQGMSLARLAQETGVTQTYPGRVEKGERSPTIDVCYSLAQALGFNLSELVLEAEKRLKRKK